MLKFIFPFPAPSILNTLKAMIQSDDYMFDSVDFLTSFNQSTLETAWRISLEPKIYATTEAISSILFHENQDTERNDYNEKKSLCEIETQATYKFQNIKDVNDDDVEEVKTGRDPKMNMCSMKGPFSGEYKYLLEKKTEDQIEDEMTSNNDLILESFLPLNEKLTEENLTKHNNNP